MPLLSLEMARVGVLTTTTESSAAIWPHEPQKNINPEIFFPCPLSSQVKCLSRYFHFLQQKLMK